MPFGIYAMDAPHIRQRTFVKISQCHEVGATFESCIGSVSSGIKGNVHEWLVCEVAECWQWQV